MAKKRVSVTLEENLVDKIDSEAERRKLNRSRMLEKIVDQHFSQEGLDTAVVLCGDSEAKTLEIQNGKPVLSHILDHLSEEGFSRVFLLAGQNKEIEENYGSEYRDLALEYVYEDEPSGNAEALDKLENKLSREFAVMNGHVITDVDVDDMFRVHREEGRTATMALTAVENPSDYGVARLKGREILGFVEKPETGEESSRLINAGTYIFSQEIFEELDESFLEYVFEKLADRSDLTGYIYGGDWKDVGES
ncbi:MAG: sugar phosphate nucleotidyltransferase [Candidatus Nanohaloarchaea archaeon]